MEEHIQIVTNFLAARGITPVFEYSTVDGKRTIECKIIVPVGVGVVIGSIPEDKLKYILIQAVSSWVQQHMGSMGPASLSCGGPEVRALQ